MSSYLGRHAELYDLLYADKPYAQEAMVVHRCLQECNIGATNRLLELACGTGSHAFELEKFGYQIVATDYSEDMLRIAQNKARQRSSTVDFRVQDMTNISIPETDFDAVVCLFDSIGYVVTNERIKSVLHNVYRYLRPDGLFICEFWHAAAMLRSYDPVRVKRWDNARGEVIRISETQLECAKQLGHVTYSIYELNKDGTYLSLKETQTNRYFLVPEMAHWLTCSGFVPVKWFAGFTDDVNIDERTWHIVAVARRPA